MNKKAGIKKTKSSNSEPFDDDCEDCGGAENQQEMDLMNQQLIQNLTMKGILFLDSENVMKNSTHYCRKALLEAEALGLKEMDIYINCPGGELWSFLALYETICLLKHRGMIVNTTVTGLAASGAALVLQAGTKRFATSNSSIMIHEAYFGLEGKTGVNEESLKSFRRNEEVIFKVWADKMNLPVKELKEKIKNKDLWFSAKEAKKNGLIDKII
jgi:ATP-dependent Clp endopeptidase proteolytic subunit ClpP